MCSVLKMLTCEGKYYYEVRLLNNETAFAAPELLPAAPNHMHEY
jgi:hypothetical protein